MRSHQISDWWKSYLVSTAVEQYIHNGSILKKLNEHDIGKEKGEAKHLEKYFTVRDWCKM